MFGNQKRLLLMIRMFGPNQNGNFLSIHSCIRDIFQSSRSAFVPWMCISNFPTSEHTTRSQILGFWTITNSKHLFSTSAPDLHDKQPTPSHQQDPKSLDPLSDTLILPHAISETTFGSTGIIGTLDRTSLPVETVLASALWSAWSVYPPESSAAFRHTFCWQPNYITTRRFQHDSTVTGTLQIHTASVYHWPGRTDNRSNYCATFVSSPVSFSTLYAPSPGKVKDVFRLSRTIGNLLLLLTISLSFQKRTPIEVISHRYQIKFRRSEPATTPENLQNGPINMWAGTNSISGVNPDCFDGKLHPRRCLLWFEIFLLIFWRFEM